MEFDSTSLVVEEFKLTEYLLDPSHPDGGPKAIFFTGQGFSIEKWTELGEALRKHARNAITKNTIVTPHGTKYTIEGPLKTPNGRPRAIRSVWIVDTGNTRPRLVTAYPIKIEGDS